MTKTAETKRKIFSGCLHPGFWVVGIALLTAGIHNSLNLTKQHSLTIPLVVGAVLGSFLCAYTKRHRRQMRHLHRTGEEVRRSEWKYRTFFENSTDAMLMIEGTEFVDCNDAAVALLGYDRKEELLHTHPSKLSPEFQPDGQRSDKKANEMMRLAQEQGAHRFEWNHLRKDGTDLPVEVSLTATDNNGTVHLHTVWRDISTRKKAEAALHLANEQWEMSFNALPGNVAILDLSGKILRANKAMQEMFEPVHGSLIGLDYRLIYCGTATPDPQPPCAAVLAGSPPVSIETQLPTIPGWQRVASYPLFNREQVQVGAISVVMDITERKKAEQALSESENLLRTLMEAIPDLIWLKDAEGVYLFCNSKFERFFGAQASEIIGKTDYDFVDKELADLFRKNDGIVMSSRQPHKNEEEIEYAADGHKEKLETLKVPVYAADGTRIGVLGVGHDITNRIRAEEERESLEQQLRQAQKMEAVGQMAGGMAHDFNNLLQVIGGYAELAQMNAAPDDPSVAALREIDKAACRGKTLINQVLAFSRRQVIRPADLNLNETIGSWLSMIHGLIGEHIELDYIAGHNLGTVHADSGMIEQVLMNLCVNARDAMPDGGKLTIETENVLIDGDYVRSHTWATPGRYVLLSVTDTGCGMPPEVTERIFEPFFTTKEVGKGTGLGLSVAFGIVEQHHGHIHVYSELGKGTIFKTYLPTVERQATEVSLTILGPVVGGTETILVAEDDETVLELAAHTLQAAGYTVLTAKDGVEALRVFNEHADELDAVVFDVVMPRMGGKEALDRILSLRPELPHLFTSGYSENAVHTNFIQKRGLNLLGKPYQAETLLRKIREVLDGE